ncbi:AAA family ATPase [Pseudoalteromonas mariniglutinosa]|uniref:AAA family ATPase n=1 Tax=Pseudoalteromonas mariniglutinosa TaxID=206042 RepID=UPI00384A9C33
MQSQILPSRAALVDRIALQFEYGQNLICLLGQSGLGKSYLLETFITDKYNEFNKSFVQLSAQMSDQQLVTQLLEQNFTAPLIDHSLTLAENYYQLYKQQPCGDCLWVIDGGRHLSPEIIEQLELLAKQSPNTLYILIASQSVGQFQQAVEIHLEALNIAESKQLMRWFFKSLPVEEDPVFRTFLQEAHGIPALLLQWQPDSHIADIKPPQKSAKLLYLLILMLITMLLMIGFLYKSDMTRWWKSYYQAAPTGEVATAIATEQLLVTTAEKQTDSNAASKGAVLAITEQSKAPKELSKNNDIAAIVASLATEFATHGEDLAKPAEVAIAEPEEGAMAESQESDIADNRWYLAQPDDNYVIQLLAVTKLQVSQQFIARNQFQDQLKVYQTLRNETHWWIVSYGSFSGLADAKIALTQLPSELRKNQPFYKKISQIKQEIARLDQ